MVKRRPLPWVLGALLALGGATGLCNDEPTVAAQVNQDTITMNDTITLEIIITGGRLNIQQPSLPPVPGFQSYPVGQSQNHSFVNGQTSSEIVFTYALSPQAPGDYVIPSFTLEGNGKTFSTKAIPVKVLSGGTVVPPPANSPTAASNKRSALFVTTTVNKKTVYVGDMVILTFRFYNRAQVIKTSYSAPNTTGFLLEELGPQRSFTESVEGAPYAVVELKSGLFATTPGAFTIGPATLECLIQDLSADPFGGFFNNIFGGGKSVTLQSDPITVKAQALPSQGKPADFKGDVGHYRMTAALDKTTAEVNEPLTLTIQVAGKGNIKTLSTPALPDLTGFKTYDTLISVNVSKTNEGIEGFKEFKTILKPTVSGALTIPSVSFSYFDPAEKTYKTNRTQTLTLTVKPGSRPDAPVGSGAATALEGVMVVGKDIRFLKGEAALRLNKQPFYDTKLFVWLNFIPGILFFMFLGARWVRGRLSGQNWKSRQAGVAARGALKKARQGLGRGDVSLHYQALAKILMDYVGAKAATPPQGLTQDAVKKIFLEAKIPPALLEETLGLWETFDQARFTPSQLDVKEANVHTQRLSVLIKKLEASW